MENNYINDTLLRQIAVQQNVKIPQINAVLQLIEGGATVPFIARYRKEVTGNLDEEQIRAIYQEWEYGQKLAQRKEDVMRLIEEKGKLTEEIKNAIIASTKLAEIEDIYRPFKEKKKTRATDAKNKGLEPLAEYLLTFPTEGDVLAEASKYVTVEVTEELEKEGKVVKSAEDALQGARDIIAEMVSDEPRYRTWIRNYFENNAKLSVEVKDATLDPKSVYEMYYAYEELIKDIKANIHRYLAINRGEKEKVLKVSISEDAAYVVGYIYADIVKVPESITAEHVSLAIDDAYKRLIKSSIEREIRSDLKEQAENQAIHVFGENLRPLLLAAPMKDRIVLGVDPAFRTGCKLAVVDQTGKVLEKSVMYPHQKFPGENVPEARVENAEYILRSLVMAHNVEIAAIGNGTASRETEAFVSKCLKKINEEFGKNVVHVIVSEAGASVYSASDLAREEFPDYEVEERSAVSIARRLQDPLAELVKIDPKSIGVGQYQHDVTQSKLSDTLDFVVETAVNQVGVNINTASPSLLKYVAGLNAGTAKKIVAHRDANGRFESREQIQIKGIGPKVMEQAIGFLRVVDGTEPLDMTSIHPESYEVAKTILEKLGFTSKDLGSAALAEAVNNVNREELVNELGIGEYTLNDILDAFVAPLRDPRDKFEGPVLRSDVLGLEDLLPGMELQGTIRNVVDFGAFVDCGVHEDGLVHVSKMSKKFIKHPLEAVKVGQIVKVWVVEVDLKKQRLQLTMIDPSAKDEPVQPKKPNNPKPVDKQPKDKKPNNDKNNNYNKNQKNNNYNKQQNQQRRAEKEERELQKLKEKFGSHKL